MKQYKEIKCEISERILTITINRPERYNAYTESMRDEIIDALDYADSDDNVRVVIVTGNPEGRNFCAGMDLGDAGSTFDYSKVKPEEHRDGGGMLTLRIFESKKPIIAAMNGSAVGVGFTMTLPMDFRIASNKAKMGAVFVRRGIVTDACCAYFLPRIAGMATAMKWGMTGKVFTAQEAFDDGILTQVVEPEEVMPTARALALDIAKNCAPVSVALVRQLMWRLQSANHPMDAHEIESMLFHWIGQQPDAAEGINSFLEKREPRYTMSVANGMPPFYPWWPKRTFRNK